MQNIQDAINLIGELTNEDSPKVSSIYQNEIDTMNEISVGDLMLIRLRGVNVVGAVSVYYNNRNVLTIDTKNFDTGGIYLPCTKIDAIGISGTVTIEGYYYSK